VHGKHIVPKSKIGLQSFIHNFLVRDSSPMTIKAATGAGARIGAVAVRERGIRLRRYDLRIYNSMRVEMNRRRESSTNRCTP